MNGWHRLWILLAIIYTIVIASLTATKIAEIKPRADASALRYVSNSTLLALDAAGEALLAYDVEGVQIKVPSKLSEEERLKIATDIYKAALKNARVERRESALISLALLVVPCVFVLLLGHGVAWVIRGFKKNEPNKAP